MAGVEQPIPGHFEPRRQLSTAPGRAGEQDVELVKLGNGATRSSTSCNPYLEIEREVAKVFEPLQKRFQCSPSRRWWRFFFQQVKQLR